MTRRPDHLTSDLWLNQILTSSGALKGGMVKRGIRGAARLVDQDACGAEIERRGFQAVRHGRPYVVFCNDQPIR